MPTAADAVRLAALAENLVGLRQDDKGRFESISLSEAHRNLRDLEDGNGGELNLPAPIGTDPRISAAWILHC